MTTTLAGETRSTGSLGGGLVDKAVSDLQKTLGVFTSMIPQPKDDDAKN